MPTAKWNGAVLAETEEFINIEGNIYFPPSALNMAYFEDSAHTSMCPWKGTANYYDIVVDGKRNENAAWVYHDPKHAAKQIDGYVAFWKGVEVA